MRDDVVLRPYQQMLVDFGAANPYSMWCVDMGLGKTLAALALIEQLHAQWEIFGQVLVVGPKNVVEDVWTREAKKWGFSHDISVIAGTAKQRLQRMKSDALVHTIHYENLSWLVAQHGRRWPYAFVIVDESSGIKNHDTVRFQILAALKHRFVRVLELTGTPSPNGLMDLWTQIYLLDGGQRLYPTITQFRNKFWDRNPYEPYKWDLREGAEAEILARVKDVCVSLKSEDYLQLPKRIDNRIMVPLPPRARAQYEQLEREYLLPFAEGDVEAANAAVLVGKLMQVANGKVYDENQRVVEIHEEKYRVLDELIESATGPVIVTYGHTSERDEMKRRYGQRVRYAKGRFMDDWNAGKIEILVAHPTQIGHGLNMQDAGNILIWFSMTYSLEHFLQMVKRIYRYRDNLELPAIIHYLVAEGTVDETALSVLTAREATQDRFYAAVKARAREVWRA